MVRLTCSRSGWGTVRDPTTGERIPVDADVDLEVAERLVDEYATVEIVDEDDAGSMEFEERIAFAESLIEESWQSIVAEIEASEADEYLAQLEKEELRRAERNGTEPRSSVIGAIEERRDALEE